MPLQLYDTFTRTVQPIKPHDGKTLRFYCCGPTVYGPAHIGNFRTFVMQDIFRRVVEADGTPTRHVRNITDVDDKTIRESQAEGCQLANFTNKWRDRFHEDCSALGLLTPHVEPSAVAHIPEQIDLITNLIDKGHAYRNSDGSVYFDVRSFPTYGQLSRLADREITTNTVDREQDDEYERNSAADFALWKASRPEDGPNWWRSPWGHGRPGWHIECSAMAMRHLGESFDLHSGGIDLVFPHHENEIAQSKCSNDSEFANYWIHSGLLKIGGEKMSKSLGNFALIKDLIKQYHFEVIRLFLISSHYRSELSFDDGSLNQARAALERLYTTLQLNDEDAENTAKENPFIEAFEMAMNDDLNTPKAVSILFDLAKELNSNKDKNSRNEQLYAFKTIANNLGLLTDKPENFFKFGAEVDDLFIQEKIDARNLARNQKDFVRADEIRDELSDMGVLLDDGPDGTTWKIEKPN